MKQPGGDLLTLMRQAGWKRLQMVDRQPRDPSEGPLGTAEPAGRGEDPFVPERTQSRPMAENRGQSDERESLSYEKPIKPPSVEGRSAQAGSQKSVGREGIEPPQPKAADLQI